MQLRLRAMDEATSLLILHHIGLGARLRVVAVNRHPFTNPPDYRRTLVVEVVEEEDELSAK